MWPRFVDGRLKPDLSSPHGNEDLLPAVAQENPKVPTSSSEDENTAPNRKRRQSDSNEQDAIASIIIYWTLGQLLPEHYDPDKRSLRVPKRPVINSPI
eukprot:g37393.t1